MRRFEELTQVSDALQPLMLTPPSVLRESTHVDWRMEAYTLKLGEGDLSGFTELELKRVDEIVTSARAGVMTSVAMMQLFAYLLHGVIGSVVHDSDPCDACICESMLFSANMHLPADAAAKLKELCDDFAADVSGVLNARFSHDFELTSGDVELLKKAKLLYME